MRKTLLLLLLSLTGCLGISAQGTENSEGTLEISSQASLAPGAAENDDFWVTVSLKAPNEDKLYTAYQMDIKIPDGIILDNSDGDPCAIDLESYTIYPAYTPKKGAKTWSHTLSYNVLPGNILRVLVKSDKNEAFTAAEGDLFDIYLKSSPYSKPGEFKFEITDIKFVSPDETKYLYKDQVLTAGTVSAESTLPLKVTSAQKISTAIFPFSCEIPDGLEVYAATGEDGAYITLGKQESITAFTPYILYAENGIDQNLQGTIDANSYPASTSVSDGHITGVLCDTQVSAGYVLQKKDKDEGPKFYKIGSTPFTIPAGKCYANPRSSNASALAFNFGSEEVDGILSTPATPVQGQFYDLQGNRVLNPQSGHIYIINGQKVLKR